jgi:hypothetical protein
MSGERATTNPALKGVLPGPSERRLAARPDDTVADTRELRA